MRSAQTYLKEWLEINLFVNCWVQETCRSGRRHVEDERQQDERNDASRTRNTDAGDAADANISGSSRRNTTNKLRLRHQSDW